MTIPGRELSPWARIHGWRQSVIAAAIWLVALQAPWLWLYRVLCLAGAIALGTYTVITLARHPDAAGHQGGSAPADHLRCGVAGGSGPGVRDRDRAGVSGGRGAGPGDRAGGEGGGDDGSGQVRDAASDAL